FFLFGSCTVHLEAKLVYPTLQIKEKIKEIKSRLTEDKVLIGITGGVCGSDIIFHEQCKEMGIESRMFLAVPPALFKMKSVAFAGNDWLERFDKLFKALHHHVFSDSLELPNWLKKKKDYNIWQRNNLWE